MTKGSYHMANQPQIHQADSLMVAFKDPHGLSWLFPDEIPENIIKSYQQRNTASFKPETVPLVDRIATSKKETKPKAISIGDKWENLQPKKFEFVKPLKDITTSENNLGQKKLETFEFSIRPSFTNIKLEEYKDDDINCYKIIGNKPNTVINEPNDTVTVIAHDPEPLRIVIPVNKHTSISEIKTQVIKRLKNVDSEHIDLIYKSGLLRNSDTIGSLGISKNEEIVLVIKQNSPILKTKTAPRELLPKLNKAGYMMSPSLMDMQEMTEQELSKIRNFSIQNQFGKIVFLGETSVLSLNLNEVIEIQQDFVDVYPETSHVAKPPIGEGLNKPAEIHLYNTRPNKPTPSDVFERKLRQTNEKSGCEFISWNNTTGEWIFTVLNF